MVFPFFATVFVCSQKHVEHVKNKYICVYVFVPVLRSVLHLFTVFVGGPADEDVKTMAPDENETKH